MNNNRSQAFCYDNRNRISAFTNGDASMQVAYAIDPWGNMTQSGTETLQVSYNTANNRITSSGFVYDSTVGPSLRFHCARVREIPTFGPDQSMNLRRMVYRSL
ncbi:MAG: hypothetical protein ABI076_00010 [Acidobacteriaceae bacterium]